MSGRQLCSSLCLLTEVRTVPKHTRWQFSVPKHAVACSLRHFLGGGKTRKSSLSLPHPNHHHQAVPSFMVKLMLKIWVSFIAWKVFAEMGTYSCKVQGDWSAIFWWINSAYTDCTQLKSCDSLGRHRFRCSTACKKTVPFHRALPWWGDGQCWGASFWFPQDPTSRYEPEVRPSSGSCEDLLTLISPRHIMLLHRNHEMAFCSWEMPLLLEEPTGGGGPYSGQLDVTLAFFHVHL